MNKAKTALDRTEKRDNVLYVWVKARNKEFVKQLADEKDGVSMSIVVDNIIDRFREEKDAGNDRQLRKRAR